MTPRMAFSAVVVAAAIASPPPLLAHHDVAAAYDVCRTVTLDGVVTKLEWRYPHVVLHLNVTGKDGKTLSWAVATPAPDVLNREGLNDFFTKTGDHVTAHVFVARDGSRDAMTQDLILPNDRTVRATMGASARDAQARCAKGSSG
jgi:Family of unknown function (DUF6152)